MGTTPSKIFPMPQSFGSVPQTANVSQVQPYQQIQGPGYAAFGAFDQTQQAPQQAPGPAQFAMGGGTNPAQRRNLMVDFNPFRGLLNQ